MFVSLLNIQGVCQSVEHTGCLSVSSKAFNLNIFLTDKYITNHGSLILNMHVETTADPKQNIFYSCSTLNGCVLIFTVFLYCLYRILL